MSRAIVNKGASKTCKLAKQRAYSCILIRHEDTDKFQTCFIETWDRVTIQNALVTVFSYPNSEIKLNSGDSWAFFCVVGKEEKYFILQVFN